MSEQHFLIRLPGSFIFYFEHAQGSKPEAVTRLHCVISIPQGCQGKT